MTNCSKSLRRCPSCGDIKLDNIDGMLKCQGCNSEWYLEEIAGFDDAPVNHTLNRCSKCEDEGYYGAEYFTPAQKKAYEVGYLHGSGDANQKSDSGEITVVDALRELVRLKDIKEQHGDCIAYRAGKKPAWDNARKALAGSPVREYREFWTDEEKDKLYNAIEGVINKNFTGEHYAGAFEGNELFNAIKPYLGVGKAE